jgi:hypothetical protein
LNGGDLAFSGDAITFVGKHYRGEAVATIDGSELMVRPANR